MKKLNEICSKVANLALNLVIAIMLSTLLLAVGEYVYQTEMSQDAYSNKTHALYRKIVAQTGQAQDALPLVIVDDPMDNAFNDGEKIVFTTGFISLHNWDEIALVLGHEVAHGMLGHLNEHMPVPEGDRNKHLGASAIAVLEANADKLGAVYMMKAGYDICKGRQIYKTWQVESGNAIGQDHPDYSYRYDELNINCGD